MRRYAAKRDSAEPAVVEALLTVGAQVERLDKPVDLAVRYAGRVYLLEVKTAGNHAGKLGDARQKAQAAFCKLWAIPYVRTPIEALRAIGAVQ